MQATSNCNTLETNTYTTSEQRHTTSINNSQASREMASHASVHRHEPTRSATWPPAKAITAAPAIASSSADVQAQAFQDDLERHPERHFLSPLTAEEYYGWDSDSDDEEDDGEWHAGITDFALFTEDRKRAMESGEPLEGKWSSFVQGQSDMFQRSLKPIAEGGDKDIPALTPDTSPNLRDDLEDSEDDELDDPRLLVPQINIQAPDYLTVEVEPSARGALLGPDEDLPLTFPFPRKGVRAETSPHRVERPGLRHARTLSGKKHVWRRPGWEMFTVGEDVIGEAEAEDAEGDEEAHKYGCSWESSDVRRGRRV